MTIQWPTHVVEIDKKMFQKVLFIYEWATDDALDFLSKGFTKTKKN